MGLQPHYPTRSRFSARSLVLLWVLRGLLALNTHIGWCNGDVSAGSSCLDLDLCSLYKQDWWREWRATQELWAWVLPWGLGWHQLSWGLPGTSQCLTGHKLISRQGLVAETSILVFVLIWGAVEGRMCPNRGVTSCECSSPPDPWVCWPHLWESRIPQHFGGEIAPPPLLPTHTTGSCRESPGDRTASPAGSANWVFALHNQRFVGPSGPCPACPSGTCWLWRVSTRAGFWHWLPVQGPSSHAKQWCWREPCVQHEECQTYPLSPGPSPQPGSGSYLDAERFIRHSLN